MAMLAIRLRGPRGFGSLSLALMLMTCGCCNALPCFILEANGARRRGTVTHHSP